MAKLRWVGSGLLCAAALWLVLAWDRIPARWTSHWGPGLRPDGFSHKSVLSVFLPLLFGAVFYALLTALANALQGRGALPGLQIATMLPLRLLAAGMAAMFAFLAVGLPLFQPDPRIVVATIFALILGPLGAGLIGLARAMARMKRAGVPELEGYRGLVYFNRDDPRLLVPNLVGLGYTLNFGRPAALFAFALLLMPAIVLLILMFALR